MRNGFLGAVGTTFLFAALAQGQVPAASRADLLPPTDDGGNASSQVTAAQDKLPAATSSTAPTLSDFTQQPHFACTEPGCCGYPAFWGSVDYLLWFVKSGPVNGPLLTTGSPTDPVPAALGQPNTHVLFGDSLNYNPLSGARFYGGVGLTPNIGLEAGYFFLSRGAVNFTAASDATGSPVIGRPYFDTFLHIPNAALSSFPGTFAGATNINSQTNLQGYELNLAGNMVRNSGLSLDVLAGFRALDLNEDLAIQDTILPPGSANLNFGNSNVAAGSIAADYDKFRTTNHFYGGQAGARLQWFYGNFSLGLTAKVALGATQQLATIDGASALLTPGAAPQFLPGGVLAQTSNIGRYYRDQFTVVPEGQLNLGWQVRPWMRLNVGYTFLYWSDVLRPGAQIDRNVNGSLIPIGQSFGLGNTAGPPFFSFHGSDFWAQGINLGVQFRY